MTTEPFEVVAEGLKVFIRLTPKAAANRIGEICETADGSVELKVQVTTVPEKGKANAALVKLLAKTWKLAKTDLSVVSGTTDRHKTILVCGDGKALRQHLLEWMGQK